MAKLISTIRERFQQRRFGVLIGAAVGALVALILILPLDKRLTTAGDGLADLSYDLPLLIRKTRPASEAFMIYMDDDSHAKLGQDPLGAWDRQLHAALLKRLNDAGAKAVVFDVVFGDSPNPPAGTRELLSEIKRGRVILTGIEIQSRDPQLSSETVEPPGATFRANAAGWGLGTLNNTKGTCREMALGTAQYPALALVVAEKSGAKVKADFSERRWLNYYGPPGAIPSVSYAAAISSEFRPENFVSNKVVFIGGNVSAAFAGSVRDQFGTPYSRIGREEMPGAEIHATTFLNLIRNEWWIRLGRIPEALLLLSVGVFFGGGLVLLGPAAATITALFFCIGISVIGIALPLNKQVWFNWAAISGVIIPLAFAWSVTYNAIKLHIVNVLLDQSLRLHLSPRRAQQLMGHPELLKPGADKLEIAIMFTDIANFSKTTERMDSGDLFGMMNNYFQVALTCIHKTDGTVIKLIGDAIFAIWNAPFPQPDHCVRAARAALALQDSVRQLEQDKRFLPLRTRVGLHVGEAHVGNVGSTERFDYTAMGDNINMASRLEGLNKIVGTQILATRAFQKLIEGQVPTRLIGHFRFKGRERTVEVHEILDESSLKTMTPTSREHFANGLFHFQRAEWDKANEGFEKAVAEDPEDRPAKFYQGMIAVMKDRQRQKKLRDDWQGEIELEEK